MRSNLLRARAPSFVALYACLMPPFGALIGIIFLGEALTFQHLGDLALVPAGLWLITAR